MSNETLEMDFRRNYEVSIWTLQDSFITVLKPFNLEHKGQLQEPKMTLKDDGTQEFSFSIPMYLYSEDGIKQENPIWYNTRNGTIIADLRKIKVIFDKGNTGERVFEFLIIKVTESHESEQLMCEVQCEGLAFHELGKIGYKIALSGDDYIYDWDEWSKLPQATQDSTPEPLNNLDYWMNKVLQYTSKWTYSVQMDWAAYDGTMIVGYADDVARVGYAYVQDFITGRLAYMIPKSYITLTEEERITLNNLRESQGMRRYDKIYEENYVSSWAVNNDSDKIEPRSVEERKEKVRLIEVEESNIYNITQTIAETFGVFCKYVYHYDDTYHIIGREIVFYNNFLQENTGYIDLTYPYHTNSISREMDATDTITKMYVKPLANDSASTGYANIMDTEANKSGEDYLLNFAYLYNIGTITQEQHDEIEPYEKEMKRLNSAMRPLEKELEFLNSQLPEKEAAKKVAEDSIALDSDRISAADDLLNSILGGEEKLNNYGNPKRAYLIQTEVDGKNTYVIKIEQEGVLPDSVKVYKNYRTNTNEASDSDLDNSPYKKDYDDFGNLIRLSNFTVTDNNYTRYLTYEYIPNLSQENVKKEYQRKKNTDQATFDKLSEEITAIKAQIESKQAAYQAYQAQKQKLIIAFQDMMGPALREGYWQPEDEYAGYGDKYATVVNFGTQTQPAQFNNNKLSSTGWDDELFVDEPYNYYEEGVNKDPVYYPFIKIDGVKLKALIDNANGVTDRRISFCYVDTPAAAATDSEKELRYTKMWNLGSQCEYMYVRDNTNGQIYPVLLLTGYSTLSDEERTDFNTIANENYSKSLASGGHHAQLGLVNINDNLEIEITQLWGTMRDSLVVGEDLANYTTVYPRIQVNSLEMQETDDTLSVLSGDVLLEKFKDYTVLIRSDENGDYYYITIKPETMLNSGFLYGGNLRFNYTIANTALLIYLDAIQVLKENSMPKVSYEITPSLVSKEFLMYAYTGLDKIAHINDYELKFENVLGYISEMELDLDSPQNDSYTIKNYKTKFEDLFSTIVAQTEQMKKNSIEIGLAAGAFTATGELIGSKVQSVMDRVDLNYAFNNGTLTIDEVNGIWGTSDAGVVAFRGGGIFTATQKNANDEWIWNTGILPSGINASLITAGQLDTNLIRIYAGDNIAFQMNGDGLFAYKWDLANDEYQNQYVVHNKDGLFLHVNKGVYTNKGNDIPAFDKVAISWEGLTLKNNLGERTFFADANSGDLYLGGTVIANKFYVIPDEHYVGDTAAAQDLGKYLASLINNNTDVAGSLNSLFQEAGEILSAANSSITELNSRAGSASGQLQGFVSVLQNKFVPNTYNGEAHGALFKVGDIWITDNGTKYMAISSWDEVYTNEAEATAGAALASDKGWAKTYDGRLANITGANLTVDAAAGIIDLKAGTKIDIGAGSALNLNSNGSINLNGEGKITLSSSSGIKLLASNNNSLSVFNLDSAGIVMGGSSILINTSASDSTNVLKLDTNGIKLYSTGSIEFFSSNSSNSAIVTMNNEKILFGVTSGSGQATTAFEMTQNYIIAAGSGEIDSLRTDTPTNGNELTGIKMTKDGFWLASGDSGNRSFIAITPGDIKIGAATSDTEGSFIYLKKDEVKIGASTNIYIHAKNIGLDTTHGTTTGDNDDEIDNNVGFRLGLQSDPVLTLASNMLVVKGAIYASSLFIGESETSIDTYLDENVKVGSANLLLKSNIAISNSDYLMATYTLVPNHNLQAGEDVCIRIWGTLGADRTAFRAFNSGDNGDTDYLGALVNNNDGTYTLKCKWKKGSRNTELRIYAPPPNGATAVSTITRIKLERGTSFTDWSPAEGELYGASLIVDANTGLIDMKTSSGSAKSAFTMNSSGITIDTNANFHVTGLGIGIDSATSIFRLGPNSTTDSVLYFKGTTNDNFTFRVGPWNLNKNSFYRNSDIFGAANSLYFGVQGLSISKVFQVETTAATTSDDIDLKHFTIYPNNNSSETDYLLKVWQNDDDNTDGYSLSLGNGIKLESALMNTIAQHFKDNNLLATTYSATSETALKKYTNAPNGSLGVVYSDGTGTATTVTLNSENTTPWIDYPGDYSKLSDSTRYLSGPYNSAWQAAHKQAAYFDTYATWWNVSNGSSDLTKTSNDVYYYNIRNGLARVGFGTTSVSFAMYSTLKASNAVSANNIVTVNFTYVVNPRNDTYWLKMGENYWKQPTLKIQLYALNNTGATPTGTKIGETSYLLDETGYTMTIHQVSVPITIKSAMNTSTTYAVVFSSETPSGMIFIYQQSLGSDRITNSSNHVATPSNCKVYLSGSTTSSTVNSDVYVKTAGNWVKVATKLS